MDKYTTVKGSIDSHTIIDNFTGFFDYMDKHTTKYIDMYTIRNTVGDFFESKIAYIFGYYNTKYAKAGRRMLDLSTRDNSCAFECKAGRSLAGGVILEKQIHPPQQQLPWINMFYVFGYHNLKIMKDKYKTKKELLIALDSNINSYYIMPNVVVSAYFNSRTPRPINEKAGTIRDMNVQMPESRARKIFSKDQGIWEQMNLSPDNFYRAQSQEKVFVMAQSPELLETLINDLAAKNV